MRCPTEVAEIVLRIIEAGLLRIRTLAWSGQSDRCAIEADHLQSLPDLLADFSREKLENYWNVERTLYASLTPESQLGGWETLWDRLRPHVELVSASVTDL